PSVTAGSSSPPRSGGEVAAKRTERGKLSLAATMNRLLKYALFALPLAVILCVGAWFGLTALDRAYPPPLAEVGLVSTEVVDRDGNLLRAFATPEGRWRLATHIEDVDPKLIKMLIAYEDHRFYSH